MPDTGMYSQSAGHIKLTVVGYGANITVTDQSQVQTTSNILVTMLNTLNTVLPREKV
jgi:hypothetical protein